MMTRGPAQCQENAPSKLDSPYYRFGLWDPIGVPKFDDLADVTCQE